MGRHSDSDSDSNDRRRRGRKRSRSRSPGEHRNYRDAGKGGGKGGGMPYGRGRGGGGGGSPWQPRDGPPGRPMGSGKGGGFKGAGGGRGGAGGGRGGGAGLEGSLNARLSAARSCDDMLLLHAQMQSSMDIRHLGLLWPKLGKRVALECGKGRAAVKQWTRAHAAGLDALSARCCCPNAELYFLYLSAAAYIS